MQKIAIKYWMEKTILHNFVNFSITICLRLQLNALTRRKGCLGKNEGKLLFTISDTQIFTIILLFGCFLQC